MFRWDGGFRPDQYDMDWDVGEHIRDLVPHIGRECRLCAGSYDKHTDGIELWL